MQSVVSTCIYCANACKLEYVVENGRITHIMPWKQDPVSLGKPCIKGLTINEVLYKGRIVKPLIRKGNKLKEVSWELAIAKIYEKISKLDPSEIFVGASGKITNEDNWVIQKFTRVALGTNNVDGCCARLCHAPTVVGFTDCLGIGASPGYLDDIPKLDCLLIIGSNPASNHPIAFQRIMQMKKKGGKVITVAPIYSETADYADIHLTIEPGTEVMFLNSICSYLIESKSYEKEAEKLIDFKGFAEQVKGYTLEKASEICGIKEEKLHKVVELIASSSNFGVMHGMGLTQHINGTASVHALVDLVLLKNGKIVTGRGEINVQGCGDMLCSPEVLDESKVEMKKLEKMWGKTPLTIGMNLIQAIGLGEAKVALISRFNPAHSMPDLKRIHKNLKKMFLVQLDSYFNLTSRFANIILPVPVLIEREGSITSGERRVRYVRKVVNPFGEARQEWQIYSWLAKLFDAKGFDYKEAKEITKEIVALVKDYHCIDVEKLYQGKDQFASKQIKFKRFIFGKFKGKEELRSKKYPFLLFTFRSRYHFLTNEATGKSKLLNKMPLGPYFYLSKEDAKKLKVKDLDEIKVSSRVASLKGYAKVSDRIPKGFIGAHFHFESLLINKLIPLEFDERTFTPNLKVVAVKIKKILR